MRGIGLHRHRLPQDHADAAQGRVTPGRPDHVRPKLPKLAALLDGPMRTCRLNMSFPNEAPGQDASTARSKHRTEVGSIFLDDGPSNGPAACPWNDRTLAR